jgi:hypothetical protein
MSAKMVLDTAAMAEEFFSDTAMIGIVSAMPDYRFTWLMNYKLDMNFVRKPDMDVQIQIKDQLQYFSVYQFCTPLNGCTHLIYQLKRDKESLLPEVKQLDYLWLIQCGTAEEDAALIANHLRSVNEVQLAQILSLDKLKNHNNLLV